MPLPVKLFIKFSLPFAFFLFFFTFFSGAEALTSFFLAIGISIVYGIIMTIVLLSLLVNKSLPTRGWRAFLGYGIPFGTWMGITFWVDAWVNFRWQLVDTVTTYTKETTISNDILFADKGEIWASICLSSFAAFLFFGLIMPPLVRVIAARKKGRSSKP